MSIRFVPVTGIDSTAGFGPTMVRSTSEWASGTTIGGVGAGTEIVQLNVTVVWCVPSEPVTEEAYSPALPVGTTPVIRPWSSIDKPNGSDEVKTSGRPSGSNAAIWSEMNWP